MRLLLPLLLLLLRAAVGALALAEGGGSRIAPTPLFLFGPLAAPFVFAPKGGIGWGLLLL